MARPVAPLSHLKVVGCALDDDVLVDDGLVYFECPQVESVDVATLSSQVEDPLIVVQTKLGELLEPPIQVGGLQPHQLRTLGLPQMKTVKLLKAGSLNRSISCLILSQTIRCPCLSNIPQPTCYAGSVQ